MDRVEGRRSRRRLAIGLAIAALAAGVVLAIVLSRDDDGDKSAASVPTETTTTETRTTETETTETTMEQTDTAPEPAQTQRRNARQVELAVVTFVEAAEQSDSERACSQVAGGSGRQLEDCAAAAGIDLRRLPSTDELQIDDVKVSGDRAVARLSNGATFTLRQSGGKWKITGFQAGGG